MREYLPLTESLRQRYAWVYTEIRNKQAKLYQQQIYSNCKKQIWCSWSAIKDREAKKKQTKQNKTNRATPKRGNPSQELSYLLNPPPGYTVSNCLLNCSPTTPSSLLISVPQRQKSSLPTLTMPLFYCWQSMLVTHGQYA